MHHRAGAHGARFNCNKEFALFQTVVTNGATSLAQGNDLSVSGRIRLGYVPVPAAAYDAAIPYDDGANGDLSSFQRTLSAAEGLYHPKFVGVGLGSWVFGLRVGYGWFVRGHVEAPRSF
jgi:hypothetical protein